MQKGLYQLWDATITALHIFAPHMDSTSTTKYSNFLQVHCDYVTHVRSAPNSRSNEALMIQSHGSFGPMKHVRSAPSSRSNSLKCDKLSNYPLESARKKSLPNQCLLSTTSSKASDISHCVCLFRMTASGTENLGDGFRCTDGSITSHNNASLNDWLLLHAKRKREKSVSSEGSSIGSFSSSGYFRVPILGLGGVGKATLLQNLKVSCDRQNSMSPGKFQLNTCLCAWLQFFVSRYTSFLYIKVFDAVIQINTDCLKFGI